MTPQEQKSLKAKAHSLKPVVIIGNKGLTEAVLTEIDLSLEHHELIKIKIAGQAKANRQEMCSKIAASQQAECLQIIGQIAVFYRKKST